ncbi:RUS family member 1 isoform X2 [Daktulosphaira vitifoliae]|uniref:RUS family member 1 isoform X2 n=1 Tax=Daktulosphaira vitifoliae TaxID=58002 RepID=UPI0021AACBF0|nr:RUS family member 1 isoform X2 [Daktulosphaira vitifoliae]
MPNETHEVLLSEEYGPKKTNIIYKRQDQRQLILESERYKQSIGLYTKTINLLKDIFLPRGFPNSVSTDYIEYQIWDTLQAFCSSIANILSTMAIMKGVGVGDSQATALAASIMFILKDGTGMIGRITFAWWKGSELDTCCKKWRLRADVLNDLAIFSELLLNFSYIRQFSLAVLTFTSSAKSIVGVAGGATRAALTQHQAIRGNMADVSAKDGSQETCINLMAFLIGLVMLPIVENHNLLIWIIYFIVTALHLFANYKAVKSLNINVFNIARFDLALKYYLSNDLQNHNVYSPEFINKREACFFNDVKLSSVEIQLGTSVHQLLNSNTINTWDLINYMELCKDYLYIIIINPHNNNIHIVLDKNINTENILKAYFHASILAQLICPANPYTFIKLNLLRSMKHNISKTVQFGQAHFEYAKLACEFVNKNFDKFLLHAKMAGGLTRLVDNA